MRVMKEEKSRWKKRVSIERSQRWGLMKRKEKKGKEYVEIEMKLCFERSLTLHVRSPHSQDPSKVDTFESIMTRMTPALAVHGVR